MHVSSVDCPWPLDKHPFGDGEWAQTQGIMYIRQSLYHSALSPAFIKQRKPKQKIVRQGLPELSRLALNSLLPRLDLTGDSPASATITIAGIMGLHLQA